MCRPGIVMHKGLKVMLTIAFMILCSMTVQAQLVSKELIRVAILWHEMWHEALEEASRLYFGEHNVDGMLNCLAPLHALLEREGPVTAKEQAFVQAYGRELQEANECCMKYKRSGKEAELTQVTAHSGGSKCHETT
jgi:FKBP12-rapamycin complex-associated protein